MASERTTPPLYVRGWRRHDPASDYLRRESNVRENSSNCSVRNCIWRPFKKYVGVPWTPWRFASAMSAWTTDAVLSPSRHWLKSVVLSCKSAAYCFNLALVNVPTFSPVQRENSRS